MSANAWPCNSRDAPTSRPPGRTGNGQRDYACRRFASRRPRAGSAAPANCMRRPGRHMMDVIIVDDEQAGRRTLREFCEAEGDLRVVGEYRRRRGRARGDSIAATAAGVSRHSDGSPERHRSGPRAGTRAAAFPGVRHGLRHLRARGIRGQRRRLPAQALRPGTISQDLGARSGRAMPSPASTNGKLCWPVCSRNSSAARAAGEETPATAGGIRRPSACARCRPGGNDRGGPQLRRHPRRPRTTFTPAARCSRRSWRCARSPCCASAGPAWSI